jgi:hypothetical protein
MKKCCGVVVGLFLVCAWSGFAAEKPMPACALLTAADVGNAVGTPAGPPHESDMVIPTGPSKGETMDTCTWRIDEQSMVVLNVVRAPQGAQREAGFALLNQIFDTLKAQGWTEERTDFGNGRCSIMTPPPSAQDVPLSTGCFAEAKGMGIGVGWISGQKTIAIEKVKALLDKAIGRLP